jgi:hypothetical protein
MGTVTGSGGPQGPILPEKLPESGKTAPQKEVDKKTGDASAALGKKDASEKKTSDLKGKVTDLDDELSVLGEFEVSKSRAPKDAKSREEIEKSIDEALKESEKKPDFRPLPRPKINVKFQEPPRLKELSEPAKISGEGEESPAFGISAKEMARAKMEVKGEDRKLTPKEVDNILLLFHEGKGKHQAELQKLTQAQVNDFKNRITPEERAGIFGRRPLPSIPQESDPVLIELKEKERALESKIEKREEQINTLDSAFEVLKDARGIDKPMTQEEKDNFEAAINALIAEPFDDAAFEERIKADVGDVTVKLDDVEVMLKEMEKGSVHEDLDDIDAVLARSFDEAAYENNLMNEFGVKPEKVDDFSTRLNEWMKAHDAVDDAKTDDAATLEERLAKLEEQIKDEFGVESQQLDDFDTRMKELEAETSKLEEARVKPARDMTPKRGIPQAQVPLTSARDMTPKRGIPQAQLQLTAAIDKTTADIKVKKDDLEKEVEGLQNELAAVKKSGFLYMAKRIGKAIAQFFRNLFSFSSTPAVAGAVLSPGKELKKEQSEALDFIKLYDPDFNKTDPGLLILRLHQLSEEVTGEDREKALAAMQNLGLAGKAYVADKRLKEVEANARELIKQYKPDANLAQPREELYFTLNEILRAGENKEVEDAMAALRNLTLAATCKEAVDMIKANGGTVPEESKEDLNFLRNQLTPKERTPAAEIQRITAGSVVNKIGVLIKNRPQE